MSKDNQYQMNLQIEIAARGSFSGTLIEWPVLKIALKRLGHNLPNNTDLKTIQPLCQQILNKD